MKCQRKKVCTLYCIDAIFWMHVLLLQDVISWIDLSYRYGGNGESEKEDDGTRNDEENEDEKLIKRQKDKDKPNEEKKTPQKGM